MFIGEYTHTIDQKKRLAVPSRFRKALGEGVVITKGFDKCLFLYPAKEWRALAHKLSKLPIAQAGTRAFARLMLAGAMDVRLDRLGRILIPDYLKKYAGLKKSVVIAGLYDRLEIWDEEKWETYKRSTDITKGDSAQQLEKLGI